jgi:hypothetical protein
MSKVSAEKKKNKFEPITLTITIENRDELVEMFNRMRITSFDLKTALGDGSYVEVDSFDTSSIDMRIYSELYDYVEELTEK